MATFTRTSSIGSATFTLTFDDAAMTLTRITALNNAPSPVRLRFAGTYVLSQLIAADGGTYTLNIPTAQRPGYEIATLPNSDGVGTKSALRLVGTDSWFGVE